MLSTANVKQVVIRRAHASAFVISEIWLFLNPMPNGHVSVRVGADLGREPVKEQQTEGGGGQGQHEVQREQVPVPVRAAGRASGAGQLPDVVKRDRARYDKCLPRLQPIHSRQDVDRVGAEDDQHHHVHLAVVAPYGD